jgi:hypothetical protein
MATYLHVVRGQEAWKRRHKVALTWNDWTTIGEALDIGRSAAMDEAHTDRPKGSRYNRAFSEWLERYRFADMDQNTRKRLLDVREHRAEIETWRATLSQSQRLRLNHPVAIWRRWQASCQEPPTPTTSAVLKKVGQYYTPKLMPSSRLTSPLMRGKFEAVFADLLIDLGRRLEREKKQKSKVVPKVVPKVVKKKRK